MRDSSTPSDFDPDRRDFLKAGATAAGAVIAGCSTGQDNNPETTEDRNDFDEPELDEVVEAELGRPGEESQFTLNENETDHIKHLSIDGEPLIQEGEVQKQEYSETYETVQKVNIEAELEEVDGNSKALENRYTTEAWSWEELLRNEFKLENGEKGLIESVLPRDWEIKNPDNPSRQLERAHIYVQEALGTNYNYQTKEAYPLFMRSAAMNDLEINPEQLPILRRKGPLGTNYIAAPIKGENKQDLGHGFPGEENFLRHNEPITQEEEQNSGATALSRNRSSAANILNVEEVRKSGNFENYSKEEFLPSFKSFDRVNDYIFADLNRSGGEIGSVGFDWDVGEYMIDLKADNEFVKNGSLFLNNFVGSDEYMHVDVAESIDELESEYGTVVDDMKEMTGKGEAAVLTERDGKVFAATTVNEEKHYKALTEFYKPEEMVN